MQCTLVKGDKINENAPVLKAAYQQHSSQPRLMIILCNVGHGFGGRRGRNEKFYNSKIRRNFVN